MKTFEEYLEEICFEFHTEVLDDDMPDFFENWLGDLNTADLLIYSEGWGRHIKNTILQEVIKMTK